MPPLMGPPPTDQETGLFAPGDEIDVVPIVSTAGYSFDEMHWQTHVQFAFMIAANVGSIDPGETAVAAWWGTLDGDGRRKFRFRATRSAGAGDLLTLSFDGVDRFGFGWETGEAAPVPWEGPDHVYAWVSHDWLEGFDRGTTSAKANCDGAETGLSTYTNLSHLALLRLSGEKWHVPPDAPSDLRVHHLACWWERNGTTTPTDDEFDAYLGQYTCFGSAWRFNVHWATA